MVRAVIGIEPIGHVESPLAQRSEAPKQGDEGAPDAWLVLNERVAGALLGVNAGDDLLVLTWLDRAARDTLQVHPRGDPERGMHGVFATRSPDRPNPIGLHRVEVIAVEAPGYACATSRPSTALRSWTSSRPSRASASYAVPSSDFFASTSIPCSRARFSPRILRFACSVSCG
jgi:tRNA-Thr(GGU) m(6)t(6)A37 methyltransferase TsaA